MNLFRRKKTRRDEIEIQEIFRDYESPIDVAGAIQKLLRLIPESDLEGLIRIVVRSSDEMSRKRRRRSTRSRSRKVRIDSVRGLYHPGGVQTGAIELFANNIFKNTEQQLDMGRRIFMTRDLGRVLFHEIGHHVDHQGRSAGRLGEGAAERYEFRYTRKLIIRIIPVLLPLIVWKLLKEIPKIALHPVEFRDRMELFAPSWSSVRSAFRESRRRRRLSKSQEN